jgi:hypothetical protein
MYQAHLESRKVRKVNKGLPAGSFYLVVRTLLAGRNVPVALQECSGRQTCDGVRESACNCININSIMDISIMFIFKNQRSNAWIYIFHWREYSLAEVNLEVKQDPALKLSWFRNWLDTFFIFDSLAPRGVE